ncbi:MAG: P-II family nitrogen regulator [Oscillospiraceae bacterium]|jgi:nitrogen regulatory protein PII|nr:P-II family nitrogen regulator [Oscillospiraceae bacterium]
MDLEVAITITARDSSEDFISLYQKLELPITLAALGRGTASREILDTLGLESREKTVIFSVASREKIRAAVKTADRLYGIWRPGTSVVLTVPLSGVAGSRTFKYIYGNEPEERTEKHMSENNEDTFDLIFVITEEGYSEVAVKAAQEKGGATGATIVHARGVGTEAAKKFFGVSIAEEKEVVLIACRSRCRKRIMEAVISEAGMHTKAKSIVFSVPVSSASGLWMLLDSEDGGAGD